MAKRPDLRQALKPRNDLPEVRPILQQDNTSLPGPKGPHFRPSRQGKANVTGYFPPSVKKQLRILAADRETTIQDLLAEALNDLFAKHGKPEIAPTDGIMEN